MARPVDLREFSNQTPSCPYAGPDSKSAVTALKSKVATLSQRNLKLKQQNARLKAEVLSLRKAAAATEIASQVDSVMQLIQGLKRDISDSALDKPQRTSQQWNVKSARRARKSCTAPY